METESPMEWVIKRVTAVQTPHSRKNWFPETKDVDGFIFFHFGKFERGVIFALTGKGLELRANKSPHLLDGKEYDRIVHLRKRRMQSSISRDHEKSRGGTGGGMETYQELHDGEGWSPPDRGTVRHDQPASSSKGCHMHRSFGGQGPFRTNQMERFQKQLNYWFMDPRTAFSILVDSSNNNWDNIFLKPCPENSCYMRILYFHFSRQNAYGAPKRLTCGWSSTPMCCTTCPLPWRCRQMAMRLQMLSLMMTLPLHLKAAGEAGEHVVKSPKKKSRRRFQPKRSPKKKAKKTHEPPQTVGEEEGDDANKESESEEEEWWSAGLMCRFPAMRGGV